jgi:hypothetical protein
MGGGGGGLDVGGLGGGIEGLADRLMASTDIADDGTDGGCRIVPKGFATAIGGDLQRIFQKEKVLFNVPTL